MTAAEYLSDFNLTTDTPQLALMVYCEDFGENWPCYNGYALYTMRPLSVDWWQAITMTQMSMHYNLAVGILLYTSI